MENDKELDYLYYNHLYDESTPLVFADGTEVYNKLNKQYITHKKGLYIYGPSGIGKTYFVNHQVDKNWIDGDVLWGSCKAFPTGEWWTWSGEKLILLKEELMSLLNKLKNKDFGSLGLAV